MHRTTPLTAATLLGLALLAPTTSASAAGETCEGVAATIVGTPDTRVAGTPGDDVILSNGAFSVEAGEGDDLICVSAAADPRGHNTDVDAGPGDDVVVVVAASDGSSASVWADLGPGRDRFRGGDGEDRVSASFDDTIVADRASDLVTFALAPGEALPSTIGSITGNRTAGYTEVTAPGRRVRMDARDRTISVDGQVVTTIGEVPGMLYGIAQHVTLVGTPGADRLVATACGLSTVLGGGGDDQILRLGFDAPPNDECPRSRMRASGGADDDRITGTINADVLRGGAGNDWLKGRRGKDVARGGSGRDTCFSERTSDCER